MSLLDELPAQLNTPEPLIQKAESHPEYPIDALGDVLGNASTKIAECVQVPKALAGQSILSVASLVAQSFNNVKVDSITCPVSLFLITVAESGDRKSSADKFALKPVMDHQREQMIEYREQDKQYQADMKAFKAAEKEILASNKKCSQVELSEKLSQLIEPVAPINPKIISREPTLEGLQKGFKNRHPGQGLFNDEGGQFFGGHAMNPDNALKTVAGLSKFWDGDVIERTRASDGENLFLENRRLSAHLMVQPVVSETVMTDPLLLGQGFLARFNIAYPESLAGTRLYKVSDLVNEPAIIQYNHLIKKLLEREKNFDESGGLELGEVEPAEEAKNKWIAAYNGIETQLHKNGELVHIKPTASKMGENILRIAGIFATLEDTKEITSMQMERAIILGNYYLKSFLWIVNKGKENKLMIQAHDLNKWIKNNLVNGKITATTLQQKAPRGTGARSITYARKLMSILVRHGFMAITNKNTKGDPSEWKAINYPEVGG